VARGSVSPFVIVLTADEHDELDWMAKLDATDRLAGGWEAAMDRHPHEQVLTQAGFGYVGGYEFITDQIWTVETLIGLVHSISFLNLEALGDQADAFEGRPLGTPVFLRIGRRV
jgi:hypothetical protein